MDALARFVLDTRHHDMLAIVKGARNGLVYGAKIRFPHALVMSFLFRSGRYDVPTGRPPHKRSRADLSPRPVTATAAACCSFKDHAKFILTATRQHSFNLGKFVFIWKTLMLLQRRIEGKEKSHHAFVAGVIGGYIVFGPYNNINYQVRRLIYEWLDRARILTDADDLPASLPWRARLCCTSFRAFSSAWRASRPTRTASPRRRRRIRSLPRWSGAW